MSYYIGSIAEMPESFKQEVNSFLEEHKDAIILGTKQEKDIHLTMMGFLNHVSLDCLYMQTNRQSQKVKNILEHDVVEIAITNDTGGIILTCVAEIVDEQERKTAKWEDWMQRYHPAGPTTSDYVLLHFIPQAIKLILIEC